MTCRTKNGGAACPNEAKWYVVADWIKKHPTCDACRVGWSKFPEARFYPIERGRTSQFPPAVTGET